MKKLIILDSNSILNRAYYGIRYLSAKDGTPTNAVYGFLNILMHLVSEYEPDYICAAFDVKEKTFRHKKYDLYKAQRHPTPDDLLAQMPIAKEILRAMGITVLEKPGYEADDIIGTVSRLCEEAGIECLIATGDKDDLQLASSLTKILLTVTRAGKNETTVYDDMTVKARYGVTPHEFIDVKALMGDTSDNIPGVKGIGEKGAMSLIGKYHSIEYIYDNFEELDIKGAMRKKLEDGKNDAFMSKDLSTIVRSVPLDGFEPEKCGFSGLDGGDNDALFEILSRLGLNSVIKRIGLTAPDGGKAAAKSDMPEIKTIRVSTAGELNALLDGAEEIAFLPKYDNGGILSAAFALSADKTTAYYTSGIPQAELNGAFKKILEDGSFIASDIKDFIVKAAPYMTINSLKFDTAIAAYLINPSKSLYTPELLLNDFLGIAPAETGAAQLSLFGDEDGADSSDAEGESGAKTAAALFALKDVLEKKLEENGQTELYYSVELPLVAVLAHMQINGFLVDAEELRAFSEMLSEKIDALTKEIYFLADGEFNINSPKQLGVVLFEHLELRPAKKTKTGYSTNAEALEKLLDKHPIIRLILKYRRYTKLKSTYCDGLSAVIDPETHRIHSNFTQTVTVTGRISSTEPNLQNIPVRTELGREIRKMFVAKEGCVLVDADYSQIELRVLADIAGDAEMQKAFLNGEDIHASTASRIFGVPLSEVTHEQRRIAKVVNFGIVYGIGEFSLAKDLGISFTEARDYMNGYLEKYSGVREYMEKIKEQASRDGFVKTKMNRIRYIPELKSANHNMRAFGERVALNTPIQGTAADIIKLAMVRVDNRLICEGFKSRLILQVHDELIIEAYEDEADEVKKLLIEEMQGAMKLAVPLIADMSEGKSWYDAK